MAVRSHTSQRGSIHIIYPNNFVAVCLDLVKVKVMENLKSIETILKSTRSMIATFVTVSLSLSNRAHGPDLPS